MAVPLVELEEFYKCLNLSTPAASRKPIRRGNNQTEKSTGYPASFLFGQMLVQCSGSDSLTGGVSGIVLGLKGLLNFATDRLGNDLELVPY